MTDVEKLRANAELAAQTLAPLAEPASFGFDRESVKWVEGYLKRQRQRMDISPNIREGLINVLGSYLGECIIQCYGGEWRGGDGGWGVFFDKTLTAYPFSKVEKQFDHGVESGDSILGFFDTIGVLRKANVAAMLQRKPWWKFW